MEPALKQRLIGAAVLLALAVIFLPMLIKGPAPESGVSDVSLDMPDSPGGEYETRELPLVSPGSAPRGGALGMDAPVRSGAALPTVDTTTLTDQPAEPADDMMPPATAGGNYAVGFGSYASAADAQRVVGALRASQLPGYQDRVVGSDGRTLYRVRIGPYASQAEAEAARLRAAHVNDDVGAKVVVLDAAPAAAAAPATTVPATAPVARPAPPTAPVAATPTTTTPLPSSPAAPIAAQTPPAPAPKPAAAGVGFAVQLGAFSAEAEADKLRDRARAAGFNAFVEQVRTDKGTLNRVRVGPVADRAEADRLKAQLAARLGIDGFVQSHP